MPVYGIHILRSAIIVLYRKLESFICIPVAEMYFHQLSSHLVHVRMAGVDFVEIMKGFVPFSLSPVVETENEPFVDVRESVHLLKKFTTHPFACIGEAHPVAQLPLNLRIIVVRVREKLAAQFYNRSVFSGVV